MRYYCILILLMQALNVSAFHGNLLQGVVRDAATGERLVGATVSLAPGNQMAQTSVLGNFRFDNLHDGEYKLTVSYIGYVTQTVDVSVRDNETKTVEIALQTSTLQLDEIVVGDYTTPDQAMTVISKIDTELRPIKTSQDILRMIPGLVTAQHAGGGKAEQIFLRGFDIDHGTDITLSVDGMPVNMVSHAHGQGYADLHFVIPETVGQVAFNKGPYYAEIGDFNTAGYATFQTRNSLDKSMIKLEAGRFDTWRAVTMLKLLNNDKKNQQAYAAAEYSFTNGPFESPQNFNRINLFAKYRGAVGDNKLLEFSLSTFSSEWDASGQIPERAVRNGLIGRFGAIDDTEGGYTGRTNGNLIYTQIFDDGSTLRHQMYLSRYHFDLYSNFTFFLNDPVNGDGIRQQEDRKIYGYRTTYDRPLSFLGKPAHLQTGLGVRYDKVNGIELSRVQARHNYLGDIALGDVDQINADLFADVNWHLTARLTLNAGARFDAFSFQYADKLVNAYERKTASAQRISPKLNLYYNATPQLQVYLKNGIGFHSNDTRVAVAENTSETLPAAYGTDLGVFAKPFPNLLVNVAVWRLHLDQEFVYVGDESVIEQGGETERKGIDLSIRYQLRNWLYLDLDGNYAHARSKDAPEGENYIPLAPKWTSIGGLTATLSGGVEAAVRYRYVADRPANEDNTVTARGYSLLDAGITYTRPRFQLALNATNILNKEWNEAQFDTETLLPGEVSSVSELTFTPGDPFFLKAGISFFF